MVGCIVDWTSVCRDLRLLYLRDDSSIEHIHELLNILSMGFVPDLLTFLTNLAGFGILAIVNQDPGYLAWRCPEV